MAKSKKIPIKKKRISAAPCATKKKQRNELLGSILCAVVVLVVVLGGMWGQTLYLGQVKVMTEAPKSSAQPFSTTTTVTATIAFSPPMGTM